MLVELSFPVALVAIVVVFVAMDALPRGAWALAAPAIALALWHESRRIDSTA